MIHTYFVRIVQWISSPIRSSTRPNRWSSQKTDSESGWRRSASFMKMRAVSRSPNLSQQRDWKNGMISRRNPMGIGWRRNLRVASTFPVSIHAIASFKPRCQCAICSGLMSALLGPSRSAYRSAERPRILICSWLVIAYQSASIRLQAPPLLRLPLSQRLSVDVIQS